MSGQQHSSKTIEPGEQHRKSLFSVLEPDVQKAVTEQGKLIELLPGESVFMQGVNHEYSYIIQAGMVRTYYVSESGREVTLGHWSEGDLIGGPLVFGDSLHVWSAIATRRSRLLAISGEQLRQMAQRHVEIYPWLTDVMSFKLLWLSNLFQVHGTEQVQLRLVKLLLMLGDIYGEQESSGIFIRHSISQTNLASLAGASRQWTNKNLNVLKDQGLIATRNHHIVLVDKNKLKAMLHLASG